MRLMVKGKRLFLFLIFISISFTLQGTVFSGEPGSVVIQTSTNNDTETGEGEKKDASFPEGSSAMKVYIDPETGEFFEGPPEIVPIVPEERLIEEKAAVSTLPEGLEEVESDMPGGGVMIDLKGRFRSYQNAVKGSDGNISIECDDDPHISPSGNAEETGTGKE